MCPLCGQAGCWREIAPYERGVVELFPFRRGMVLVARFQCRARMRTFSLLFALISLVMLVMFFIYVLRGPVEPLIAGGLFLSFVACAVPAALLLKPFDPPEELRRRKEARRERARRRFTDDGPRDRGS